MGTQDSMTQRQVVKAYKTGISGLSSEQWSLLLNMLNSQKESNQGRLNGTYKVVKWIIDIRTSHHVTRSLELMSDVKEVFACPIGLPNGNEAIAKKEGTVVLNEHLKLNNVLYAPNLKCNLISASQLVEE